MPSVGFFGAALGGLGGSAIGSAVVTLYLADQQYQAQLQKAKGTTEAATLSMGQRVKALGPAFAVAGAAAAVGIGVQAVKAFNESEAAIAQTNAVLKSTKGIAGVTATEVTKLAAQMQNLTTFSDEEVRSAENLLLTFTNIGHNIFPETTKAVLDMSQALGQDLKSSSIQLGKALNDPISGLTSLSRVGVKFTQETKDQIKTLVEQGKTLEAQRIILGELATEFGGSATAAAKTFAGQMKQLGNQLNNVLEQVGEFIVAVLKDLLPALKLAGQVLGFAAKNADLLLIAFAGFAAVKWVLPFLDALTVKIVALSGASLTAQGAVTAVFAGFAKVVPPAAAAIAGVALANRQLDADSQRAAKTLRDNVTWLIANRDAGQSWASVLDEIHSSGGNVSTTLLGVGAATRQFTQELDQGNISQGEFNEALLRFGENDDPEEHARLFTEVLKSLNQQVHLGILSAPQYKAALEALGLAPNEVAAQFDNLQTHVTRTGRTVRNFAGLTGAALKEFKTDIKGAFTDAVNSMNGFSKEWAFTSRSFRRQIDLMRQKSETLGDDLRDFGKLKAIPEPFQKWLLQQGPDAVHAFVGASAQGRSAIISDWQAIEGNVKSNKTAIDRVVDGLKNVKSVMNDLDGKRANLNVHLAYSFSGSAGPGPFNDAVTNAVVNAIFKEGS